MSHSAHAYLETIEKEYQEYAYTVSHDLNAPLRHVRQFSNLLLDSLKYKLNDEEIHYAEYIEKALKKMDAMQNALLVFSRIHTMAQPFSDVDLNKIIDKIVVDLMAKFPQVKFQIDYANLPIIRADLEQMKMLFLSLLDNAVKFRDDDRPAVIQIQSRGNEHSRMIDIIDNGIGINEVYHEEVFRIFKRLNPDRYDGVGANLAIARKIMRRHGGEITLKNNADKGVCFSLCMPGHKE